MGTFELSQPEVLEILRADERTLPFTIDGMDPDDPVTHALAQMQEDHMRLQAARIVNAEDEQQLTDYDEVLEFMLRHGTPVDLWRPFGIPIQVTEPVN